MTLDASGRPAPAACYLFDVARQRSYAKPRLRGGLHGVCFVASIVVGVLLIQGVHGAGSVAAVSTYAGFVIAMFGVSAGYHLGTWSARAARTWQRLDHVMIVMLIAGSATPPLDVSLRGDVRAGALIALWTLAVAAAVLRLAWMSAPERLVGGIYVGLGWLAGAAVPAVWLTHGAAPAILLVVGGLLYTVGAIGYHLRRPDPSPAYFGYHEVFHTYVAAAAAVHYVAIACLLY